MDATDPMVDAIEEDTEPDIIPDNGNGNGHHPAAAASVWEALSQRRAQLAGERHLDLEVPGTFGMFSLRLGPISGQKQAQLTDRLQKSKSPDRDFNLNADFLANACQAILGRQDRNEELEPLTAPDGQPLDLHSLGALFGLPAGTRAREVIRQLYSGAPSPEMAVTIAGGEYVAWAGGIGPELDEEALGEA
jgi:hypothetical protein